MIKPTSGHQSGPHSNMTAVIKKGTFGHRDGRKEVSVVYTTQFEVFHYGSHWK